MKRLMTAAAVSVIILTSACGAERPTKADLAEKFESQSSETIPIDADAAKCMADEVHGSDLSNGTVKDIADGKIDLTDVMVEMPKDDIEAWKAITDDVVSCVTG